MFTNSCGDISALIKIPVLIMSFILMSLSSTINAPVFVLESSETAITIL